MNLYEYTNCSYDVLISSIMNLKHQFNDNITNDNEKIIKIAEYIDQKINNHEKKTIYLDIYKKNTRQKAIGNLLSKLDVPEPEKIKLIAFDNLKNPVKSFDFDIKNKEELQSIIKEITFSKISDFSFYINEEDYIKNEKDISYIKNIFESLDLNHLTSFTYNKNSELIKPISDILKNNKEFYFKKSNNKYEFPIEKQKNLIGELSDIKQFLKEFAKANIIGKDIVNDNPLIRDMLKLAMQDLDVEEHIVISVSSDNKIKNIDTISRGNSEFVSISKKEILKKLIENDSTKCILAHNHTNSYEVLDANIYDLAVINSTNELLKNAGIRLCDAFIVSSANVFSFAENSTYTDKYNVLGYEKDRKSLTPIISGFGWFEEDFIFENKGNTEYLKGFSKTGIYKVINSNDIYLPKKNIWADSYIISENAFSKDIVGNSLENKTFHIDCIDEIETFAFKDLLSNYEINSFSFDKIIIKENALDKKKILNKKNSQEISKIEIKIDENDLRPGLQKEKSMIK